MKRHVRHIGISVAAMLVAAALTRDAYPAPGIVWERVDGIYGSPVRRVAGAGDGVLFAGTNEGLYRSEDGGESWKASALAGLRVGVLSVDGPTVYVGAPVDTSRNAPAALLRSDDRGVTWEVTELKRQVNSLVAADGVVYATTPNTGSRADVYRSDDGGVTWSEMRLDGNRAVGVIVTDEGVVVASTGTVFRSADGQDDWADISEGLPADRVVGIAQVGRTPYIATEAEGVYRLDPDAETWSRTSLEGVEVGWLQAAGGALYAGTQGGEYPHQPGVVSSRDGGQTWRDLNIADGLDIYQVAGVGPDIYVASRAGVLVSKDAEVSWRNVGRGLLGDGTYALAADGNRVYVGGEAGVHASNDGGRTWRHTGFYWPTAVLATDDQSVYVATWSRGLFRSDDGGHAWREVNDGVPTEDRRGQTHFASGSPREILRTDSYIYVAYYHGAFLRSAQGESWESVSGSIYDNNTPRFAVGDGPLAIGKHDGALYVNAHCYTARTFDDGVTWEELQGCSVRGADLHTFDGQLYIAAETGVFRWNETTREWLDVSDGLPLHEENDPGAFRGFHGTRFASLGKSLYVGSQVHNGVYRLYAGTDEWVSAGLEGRRVWSLLAYEDGMLAGTDNGLFRASVDQNVAVEPRGKGVTAWAEVKLAALTPERSALLPNYPNPFNPETWIPFDLAESASVAVNIYDARGRVVRTLDLGHLAPGRYRSRERAAYWDGRDSAGSPMASGVYICEISAGAYRESRRMVVLK